MSCSILQTPSIVQVRTVADLQSVPSECITIPDDPVGSRDDVIAVEERDPLCVSPTLREASAAGHTDTVPEDTKTAAEASKSSVNLKEVSGRDYIMINNALVESKIDQLVEQNFKYDYGEFAAETVRKMLAVRVVLGVDYNSFVPKHKVKTVDWPVEDEDVQLETDTTENENGDDEVEGVREDIDDRCNDTQEEEKNVNAEEQSANHGEDTNVVDDEATVNDDDETVSRSGTDDEDDVASKETDDEDEDTEVDDENDDCKSEPSDDANEGDESTTHSASEHKNNKHNNVVESCLWNDERGASKDGDDESGTKIGRDEETVKGEDKDSYVCVTSKLDDGVADSLSEPSKVVKHENECSGDNVAGGQLRRLTCDKPNTSVSAFNDNSSSSDEDHDDFVDNLLKRDIFSNEPITTDFGIEVDGK